MSREFGDRPGDEVVEQLWGELSRELGTDAPEFTETRHGQNHQVGHLVADESNPDMPWDEVAIDTHDTDDLSAEESAMHFEDDGGEEEELTDDVLHDLEDFGQD